MRHQREPDDRRRDGEVIHPEIRVVLADPDGGVGNRLRFGQCGAIRELSPGTTLGEAVSDGF